MQLGSLVNGSLSSAPLHLRHLESLKVRHIKFINYQGGFKYNIKVEKIVLLKKSPFEFQKIWPDTAAKS